MKAELRWELVVVDALLVDLRFLLYSARKGGKRDQCCRSILGVEWRVGLVVRKAWCGPMSSEWKKVVRVGWSSVRPGEERRLVGMV